MAIMYPESFPQERRDDPKRDGEALFYDACRDLLPREYRVFYSFNWRGGGPSRGDHEGEVDFVILHPKHGLMFLEVKGGGVRFDRREGVWLSSDRYENEHPIRDPIGQVSQARRAITEYLKRHLKLGRSPSAACAIVFPHGAYNPGLLQAQNWPRELTLFESDLEQLEPALHRTFEFAAQQTSAGHPPLSANQVLAVERLWAHGDARSVLAPYLQQDAWAIQRLTEQQTSILDTTRSFRRLAVKGGAGTGKTVLAAEKATRLAQQGLATLLTCRSTLLASHLGMLVGQLPDPKPVVMDFRELCIDLGLRTGVLRERPDNPLERKWTTELPLVLLEALEDEGAPKFDAVIVDEGQDFVAEWWTPLLLTLKDGDDGTFWVFYDDNQRVFARDQAFPDLPDLNLDENLRNTREIFSVFRPFYPGQQYRPSGPPGRPVKVTPIRDVDAMPEALRGRLHFLINEQKIPYRDITVLTGLPLSPRLAPHSTLVGRDKVGTFRLNTELCPAPAGQVSLQSILSFKGMESSVVILVELEQCLVDDAQLYIGLSRAKTYLEIIGTEQVTELIQCGKLALPE